MKSMNKMLLNLAVTSFAGAVAIAVATADETPTTMPSTRPAILYTPPPATQPVISAGQPASTQPVFVGGPTIGNGNPVTATVPSPVSRLHGVATDPGATPVPPANVQQNTGVGVGIGNTGPNMAGPTSDTGAPGSIPLPTTVPTASPIRR